MSITDSELMFIGEFESTKYKAAEFLDNAPRGSRLSYIDVFGENCTDDEYIAFSRVAEAYNRYDFYHENTLTYWRNMPQSQEEMDEVSAMASQGDTVAMMKIAYFLKVSNRPEDAVPWMEGAARRGSSDALDSLGASYKYGLGVELDLNKAIDYYKQAILLDGNDEALHDLALCYLHGEGVPQDFKKGYDLMIRSARQGNAMARYDMGWMYHYGRGVDVDFKEALKWYELGAGGYYVKAYTNLTALCYEMKDYERMLSWTKRYMELDEPKAFFRMGCYLLEGVGVEKNLRKGIEYLRKAAEQEDPMAHAELARAYSMGEGVEPDQQKSFYHLSEAARLRHPHAEFYLGRMIWETDRERALSLIQDAASQWHTPAQEFLRDNGLPIPPTRSE